MGKLAESKDARVGIYREYQELNVRKSDVRTWTSLKRLLEESLGVSVANMQIAFYMQNSFKWKVIDTSFTSSTGGKLKKKRRKGRRRQHNRGGSSVLDKFRDRNILAVAL